MNVYFTPRLGAEYTGVNKHNLCFSQKAFSLPDSVLMREM